jgi:hypothetical protein
LGTQPEPFEFPAHTAHVPEPPHAPGWLPVTHVVPEQQKPLLHVPSFGPPQADVHAFAVHVGAPDPQGVQAWPSPPHAPFAVPAAQVPLLQQPRLHPVSFAPRQPVPHVCVLVLQAWPAPPAAAAGQSVGPPQPHVSVPPVPDTHLEPFALPAQLTHAPDPPQALSAVPAAHVPALQQPPLHACVASHLLEQTWPLHDSSAGQSPVPLQPHDVPFSQRWPLAEAVQSLQEPDAPHALFAVPEAQLPFEQQPPLQFVVPLPHDDEHTWVVPLHA